MQDMQARLEKLRTDAAECALIRDLAINAKKREFFTTLAEHLNVLASDVERAMTEMRDDRLMQDAARDRSKPETRPRGQCAQPGEPGSG
jgi:hypothetical protein